MIMQESVVRRWSRRRYPNHVWVSLARALAVDLGKRNKLSANEREHKKQSCSDSQLDQTLDWKEPETEESRDGEVCARKEKKSRKTRRKFPGDKNESLKYSATVNENFCIKKSLKLFHLSGISWKVNLQRVSLKEINFV